MRINNDENAKLLLDTVPGVMRSIREEMRGIARGKFTVPQFRILNKLRKGALTNSELAEWMGITAPTMSRMLEPLEDKGYILRTFNPNDRRSQSLTLSASGRREAEKIRRHALDSFASRIESLSNEETQTLSDGLKVLAKLFNLETNDAPAERNKSSMKTKSITLMMLVALSTSLSSCLGDKTADDWAKEQSNKEQAKLQEIADTYRGTLVSTETGQTLGSLTLNLATDSKPQDSGVNKILVPTAKGTLIYKGVNQSEVTFDQYFYDSESKLLKIDTSVPDALKKDQNISLRATLKGNTLEGTVELDGGYSGTFSLVRRGPIVQAQNLSAIRGATAIAAGDEHFDSINGEGNKLVIQYSGANTQQLFLNLLSPQRIVTATVGTPYNAYTFALATLDERYDSLIGETTFNGYQMKLQCGRTGAGTPSVKWSCKVTAGTKNQFIDFALPTYEAQ